MLIYKTKFYTYKIRTILKFCAMYIMLTMVSYLQIKKPIPASQHLPEPELLLIWPVESASLGQWFSWKLKNVIFGKPDLHYIRSLILVSAWSYIGIGFTKMAKTHTHQWQKKAESCFSTTLILISNEIPVSANIHIQILTLSCTNKYPVNQQMTKRINGCKWL